MQADSEFHEIAKYLGDKEWRMANLYYIRNKRGKVVLFKRNDEQVALRKSKHRRKLVLKARQLGITTDEAIDKLDNCLFSSNYIAGIICDTVPNAEKVFKYKIKFAFDRLPEWLKSIRAPNTDKAGELSWQNGSVISVSTSFRGGTLSSLHVSEYGKICRKYPEKAKEIKSGAFEAVPLDGELMVESTAEGMEGDFFDMYEVAAANQGKELTELDFELHFFPWYGTRDYRLDPKIVTISDENKAYFKVLKQDQGIDLDAWQMAWYQKKSENQEDMKQEYPSYPIEAFMASGRPVFNLEKIARDIRRTKQKTPIKGIVSDKGFEELSNGPVLIWKKPDPKETYSIGADVAEGLVDGDFSTASVLNKNFEQVATYCGHLPPDKFGAMLVNLAKYFNGALLAPEINNMGISVIEAIKRAGYYKVYKREVKEELGQDRLDKVGWHTNIKTKMQMLDDLKAAFRDDVITINDEHTLREMMTLTVEDDGNVELNSKDRTVALAIAIQGLKQANINGEYKAFTPGKTVAKDVTKLSIEDKLKLYKRMNKE